MTQEIEVTKKDGVTEEVEVTKEAEMAGLVAVTSSERSTTWRCLSLRSHS
jgi:hypothetical protein